jgi:hypothetical protein
MDYDRNKVDEMVLALLTLTMMKDGSDFSEEGARRAQELFALHFGGAITE